MNDENLRLTGSANNPYMSGFSTTGSIGAATGTTFSTTAQYFGANRPAEAKLYLNKAHQNLTATATMKVYIQQATTSNTTSASWFDIAVFPDILGDGLATQTGADPTGIQGGVETSAFTVKSEIPGVGPLGVQFLPTMDYLRVKIVAGGANATCQFDFRGIGVEVEDVLTPFKRSGEA